MSLLKHVTMHSPTFVELKKGYKKFLQSVKQRKDALQAALQRGEHSTDADETGLDGAYMTDLT